MINAEEQKPVVDAQPSLNEVGQGAVTKLKELRDGGGTLWILGTARGKDLPDEAIEDYIRAAMECGWNVTRLDDGGLADGDIRAQEFSGPKVQYDIETIRPFIEFSRKWGNKDFNGKEKEYPELIALVAEIREQEGQAGREEAPPAPKVKQIEEMVPQVRHDVGASFVAEPKSPEVVEELEQGPEKPGRDGRGNVVVGFDY